MNGWSARDGARKERRPDRDAPSRGVRFAARGPAPVQEDRPSRARLFWRRQRRLVRPGIVCLFVLGLAALGARFLYDAASEERFAPLRARLVAMEPLPIRHIVINGRGMTGESAILDALGTAEGKPIFGFSVEAARQRIDALPFVAGATVERRMPDTVVVTLTERAPVAIWQDHGHFVLINRAGDEVPDEGLTGGEAGKAFAQLPLVVGDGANLAAAAMIDALAHQPEVKARVTAMVRVGQRRWNLRLKDGTAVLLPEGQEAAALARLARYQDSMQLLDRPVQEIDLRLPDRLVIHQPPPPPVDSASSGDAPPGDAKAPEAKNTETKSGDGQPAPKAPRTAAAKPVKPVPPKSPAGTATSALEAPAPLAPPEPGNVP